ncbi:MAG: dimeric alpha+beta barrel [Bradyrhizobium sp.]|nr:MAG: dimeric alpha+beta barrel [Bradyrhizobium sp.]
MKFIAIIDVVPGAPLENVKADLPNEVRESWKLFAAGALREAYATDAPTRVVFVLESADAASAATDLGKLPLIRAGLLAYELIELRPFANWSLLFAR